MKMEKLGCWGETCDGETERVDDKKDDLVASDLSVWF